MRHRRRFIIIGLLGVGLVGLPACGSDTSTTAATTGTSASTASAATTSTSTTPTETPGTSASDDGGWVGGEPEWTSADGSRDGSASAMESSPELAPMAGGDDMAAETAPFPVGGAEPIEGDTYPAPPTSPDTAELRAGNVDDNADFVAFIDYLDRIESLGVTTRPFDPTGRIVVSVVGADGRPAAGVEVAVTSANGTVVATIRSTADGSARFLPALYGTPEVSYTFTAIGASQFATPDSDVTLTVQASARSAAPLALDVLFLLDATGSMGDEIDRLKTTIDAVAGRIAAMDTQPDVRFAMTMYRDLADTFVTSTYDFTGNIDDFRAALDKVVAEGGDDYPEALDEGLAEALGAPSWRDPATTMQLVFLIADAPPQVGRQVDTTYVQSITAAVSRGIKVFPIASSESDDQAEAVFRQIAQATGARFVFLAGGANGAATGPGTDIDSTDYEELALDDLIVRLVSEELEALTGVTPIEPTGSTEPTTSTSDPEGQ